MFRREVDAYIKENRVRVLQHQAKRFVVDLVGVYGHWLGGEAERLRG
jgi:hypothetical protein